MRQIVIIGPESTGKSTLCSQLAEHYKTVWCPEFAREYLLEKGMNYSYDDLLKIAHGQLELEDVMLAEAKNGLYFIDTDMYVMKVWCEVAFENCHTWILKQIAKRKYDLYLLCSVDLPWQKDELREYPDLAFRKKLFTMYKDIVINSNTMWAEISGTDAQRLQMAVGVIDTVFGKR
ncbi:MAG TPA: ATP-binding protein [Flavisolibacter sp.]|nr:ATP-binding protein [Flavisolibacter sp.]